MFWSIVKCLNIILACGVKNSKPKTLTLGGRKVTQRDYPWHAAIYTASNNKKTFKCGGTIVNHRAIITGFLFRIVVIIIGKLFISAAHCMTNLDNGVLMPKSNFIIAVGKYFKDFSHPLDDKVQNVGVSVLNHQYTHVLGLFHLLLTNCACVISIPLSDKRFLQLRDIFVPNGFKSDYVNDIAVLITNESLTFDDEVHPVCIDRNGKYEDQFLKPHSSGYVSSFRLSSTF